MDRKVYKVPFTKDSLPDWQCPTCQKGLLKIKKGTFFSEESSISKKGRSDNDWEPEWFESSYSCLLECSNIKCNEIVSNSGKGFLDWEVENVGGEQPEQVWSEHLKSLYFYPHLKLISISQKVPDEVRDKLYKSFELFFISPSASSNHIRVAVELLLNDLNVKRFRTNNSKRYLLSLHQRISLLPQKYEELKEMLLAVKWLGNAGSHAEMDVTADDVMDSLEIMEHILSEVYDKKSVKLKALAKKVNKSKGPQKRSILF